MLKITILPQVATRDYDARLKALRGMESSKFSEEARLEEVSKEFETLMVEMMIKSMRKNVPDSPLFGKNKGEEIFQEMLDSQYARVMVDRRGFGIAEALVRQFKEKL